MSNDNQPQTIAEMDLQAYLNLTYWLTAALESGGAKKTDARLALNETHVEITLDGCPYLVTAKPLPLVKP